MSEGKVLMQKDGETKRVEPGSVEVFRSVGWEKIGEDIGETPDITDEVREDKQKTESSEGNGPMWSERIVMKQNKRNITVELWPPSDEHPEWGPNLRLVESYNNDGTWETQSIRLTRGPKTLFLSELIREGWKKLREHS